MCALGAHGDDSRCRVFIVDTVPRSHRAPTALGADRGFEWAICGIADIGWRISGLRYDPVPGWGRATVPADRSYGQ
uniref:Uncharacterized protein n=1 Tax=Octopus bimaculoides TaxID=37653 RepID=A0A0L8HCW8_OCTBM